MLNIYADLFGALEPGTEWHINIESAAIIHLPFCFQAFIFLAGMK